MNEIVISAVIKKPSTRLGDLATKVMIIYSLRTWLLQIQNAFLSLLVLST